jgi:putative phosphoribosyl transferase
MRLFRKRREPTADDVRDSVGTVRREVLIAVDPVRLPGELVAAPDANGIVIFAHGSGSSRLSPRNLAVSRLLNGRGMGTLLFDLLTPEESEDRARVFDIELLAGRLGAVAKWMATWPSIGSLPVGFFGASTGAAAALVAAAKLGPAIAAVVSRGGRPDLAGQSLGAVTAPTLLIVGGQDVEVLELNRQAERRLVQCETRLEVVPGAGHLFEEPGRLEVVAELAADWFVRHLVDRRQGRAESPR